MELAAVYKIIITFAGVLVLNRLRTPLGLALILGGILLNLWSGQSISGTGTNLVQAFFRPELWLLVINITLIIEVGYFMSSESNAKTIINAAKNMSGKHGQWLSLILIPATIGLVPMPGGALFSAPLIDQTANATNVASAGEWKAAVNYWFRHILEYWWPLYPVVIVTLSIFPVPIWQYFALFMPFTLINIVVGYFFLLRNHPTSKIPSEKVALTKKLLPVLLPILIIVTATLLLPGVFAILFPNASTPTATMLAMLLGLLIALALIHHRTRHHTLGSQESRLFANLFTSKTGNVVLTLIGVMIFQAMLNQSSLLPLAGKELAASRVPLFGIIAILPFLSGLVTGIAVGFAGISFPLVEGLIAFSPGSISPLAALVLAFTMGYSGMMLSPVHLCFVLTKDFFNVPFSKVYRHIFPCVFAVMAIGMLFSLILNSLGW